MRQDVQKFYLSAECDWGICETLLAIDKAGLIFVLVTIGGAVKGIIAVVVAGIIAKGSWGDGNSGELGPNVKVTDSPSSLDVSSRFCLSVKKPWRKAGKQ